MRRLILAGLVLVSAATVFDVPSADAQVSSPRNPWCLRDGPAGGPGSWDCSYQTWQQCEATRFGAGGSCGANPNYNGPGAPDRPRQNTWDGRSNGTWGRGGGNRW
jgi:Protein of unknown function (DUF3551)